MEVKFDTEAIRLVTLFENLTGAPVKDCIVDNSANTIYFVIGEGKVGMAIGKNGSRIKNVENLVGKNIKIFEFSRDLTTFIKNIIPQVTSIKTRTENERTIVEINVEKKDKALIIGRDGKNLKIYKEILQRSHGIGDLIVR
jgi:N utilization substance protein A